MIEIRAVWEFAAASLAMPLLLSAPCGKQPVMVLPGFLAADGSTLALRQFLKLKGYPCYGWQQGRNLGQHITPGEHLIRKDLLHHVVAIVEREKCPVHLIGWSLGGIIAREIARLMPEIVASVITLGSPFNGPEASSPLAAIIFKKLNMRRIGHDFAVPEAMSEAPPVPCTSIYSKSDGISHWLGCHQRGELSHVENIRVISSHLGLGHNPVALWVIAQRLAQNATQQQKHQWQPLTLKGLPGWMAAQMKEEHLPE